MNRQARRTGARSPAWHPAASGSFVTAGTSAQVRAAYTGAWGEVIRDEDRPTVKAISLQRWAGLAWAGQWEHQTYLAVPATRGGKAGPGGHLRARRRQFLSRLSPARSADRVGLMSEPLESPFPRVLPGGSFFVSRPVGRTIRVFLGFARIALGRLMVDGRWLTSAMADRPSSGPAFNLPDGLEPSGCPPARRSGFGWSGRR